MSRKNQDAKRQLFKNITGASTSKPSAPPSSPLDESASNLFSRTLRKHSDKHKANRNDSCISPHNQRCQKDFVIHKTLSPEQYQIFNSAHPIRESKLQALEISEKAFENLFHPDKPGINLLTHSFNANYSTYNCSSDEEDSELPDISNLPQLSELYEDQDDILLSIPGYSKEEILAIKKLRPKNRKNLKFPKQNALEAAFSSQASLKYLRGLSRNELQEYHVLNKEFEDGMFELKSLKQRKLEDQKRFLNDIRKNKNGDFEDLENTHLEVHQVQALREAMANLDNTNWMFDRRSL